ncbi:MAG: signal peptidase I [bacterium]
MKQSLSPRRPQPRSRLCKAAQGLLPLAVFAVILLTARASVADHYRVPSGSMLPTVEIGDRVLVDKSAYGIRLPLTSRYLAEFSGPRRGDVVVLESPEDREILLKRVVAVPGDLVEVRAGLIRLNGAPVRVTTGPDGPLEHLGHRAHRIRLIGHPGPALGPLRIPPGRYLVLGDNRGDSHDGRYFGLVPREAIHGRALRVYYRRGFTWRKL